MKNLKTLLFPLLFSFGIHNSAHSQELVCSGYKNVEYHKKHIKSQIKACYSTPPYSVYKKTDKVSSVGLTFVNSSEKVPFSVAASKEVSKEDILSLIKKYDDPSTPYCIEAGVKFNRYFLCGIDQKFKCINASDIEVYKAKCGKNDRYTNTNVMKGKALIIEVDPKK